MELKKLSLDNIDEIKAVILDAFSGEPWYDDWQDPAQFDRYIIDLIGNNNSLSLGGYDGGTLVAAALGRIKHWYAGTEYWIDDLGVISSAQGKGFGSEFISLMERYLKERRINKIVLLTNKDVPAFRFYAKNGFTVRSEKVVYEKYIPN